jgi:hypothetical protein
MSRYLLANAALSAGMGLSANGAPLLMNVSFDHRPSRHERHEVAAHKGDEKPMHRPDRPDR